MANNIENAYSDLVFHVFRYAAEQLSQNNVDAVLSLGFTVEEINKINKLTLDDVRRLCQFSKHFLTNLNIDHDSFHRVMDRLDEAKCEEEIQDKLIKLGAPHAMMCELFGMNGHEYAQRRKLLSLTRVGRPPIPSEEDQIRIYEAWNSYENLEEAEKWLKIGEEIGITLTAVWPLVKTWSNIDLPSGKTDFSRSIPRVSEQRICA